MKHSTSLTWSIRHHGNFRDSRVGVVQIDITTTSGEAIFVSAECGLWVGLVDYADKSHITIRELN